MIRLPLAASRLSQSLGESLFLTWHGLDLWQGFSATHQGLSAAVSVDAVSDSTDDQYWNGDGQRQVKNDHCNFVCNEQGDEHAEQLEKILGSF